MADTGKLEAGRTALAETDEKGAFIRKDSVYRNRVSADPAAEFPAVKGRYQLIISYACPWANGCLVMRNLKGLQDVIGLSVVHPTWQRTKPESTVDQHSGWAFAAPGDAPLRHPSGFTTFPCDESLVPFVDKEGKAFKNVRAIYESVGDDPAKGGGKYTVPILFDKEKGCIVNNESQEILRMLNKEFNALAAHPELDLCPDDLNGEIDAINEWVYPNINNGVYRCGFAKSQEAYDQAVGQLFGALDRAEALLGERRFITGPKFTLMDIRLFMTLVRFDEVYVVYFKTNKARIADYPNLRNYCREVYQLAGMAETINMSHIKTHYFSSHPVLNAYGIIPEGPNVLADLQQPHDRDRLPAS